MLFIEGGVYADLDVECRMPIDYWLAMHQASLSPKQSDSCAAVPYSAIVGVEGLIKTETAKLEGMTRDALRQKVAYTDFMQYCQWVMASAPGDPLFKDVVRRVLANAKDAAMHTLHKTGPGVFTKAVIARIKTQVSTRILGRRTAHFPPLLNPVRVPRGFTPRSSY